MATINLLKEIKFAASPLIKKAPSNPIEQILKSSVPISIAISSLTLITWTIFTIQLKNKENTLSRLSGGLSDVKAEYERISVLINDKSELEEQLAFFASRRKSDSLAWSKKLNNLYNAIPQQIWLTNIRREKEKLSIRGSSASLKEGEIIDSIWYFTTNLKKYDDFSSVDLGTLKENNQFDKFGWKIMDFSINTTLSQ